MNVQCTSVMHVQLASTKGGHKAQYRPPLQNLTVPLCAWYNLTGKVECIVLSSDEEGGATASQQHVTLEVEESGERGGQKRNKKRKIISPQTLFQGSE